MHVKIYLQLINVCFLKLNQTVSLKIRQGVTRYQNRKAFSLGVGGGNKCSEIYDLVRSKAEDTIVYP